jgi:cysteine desulfurase/selenocysteine lyase
VHRGIHTLSEESTRAFEVARDTVAQLLNATSTAEVIFTAGTTAAINTVARSWGDTNVKAGDTILLTIAEHHANIVPWQQLAERTGCQIAFLPVDPHGQIADETLAEHLERLRPKMFAFMAVSNVLGTEFPVARWTRMAHAAEAVVLVDAAQAVPHMPVDVQDWDADFVVFSGHKICGPTGIGILYGKESVLESMPPFLGGGAMIRTVTTEGYVAGELPQKFEAGTPPIVEAIGLAAAIDYVRSIGLPAIHAYEQQLTRIAMDALSTVEGVRVFGPPSDQRAGIISFIIDDIHPHDVSQWLDIRGIAVRAGHHCAMPLHHDLGVPASCRASFYFYNTVTEAENFGLAIAEMKRKFARRRRT